MEKLLKRLQKAFPDLKFAEGSTFSWSPRHKCVTYPALNGATDAQAPAVERWSLLHEVGHALLDHKNFRLDFELVHMEVAAWNTAKELAARFGETIDEEHIQDCLDTYRDWLYQRSTCPTCLSCSLQPAPRTYACHNCGTTWRVSASRHCRAYRRRAATVN